MPARHSKTKNSKNSDSANAKDSNAALGRKGGPKNPFDTPEGFYIDGNVFLGLVESHGRDQVGRWMSEAVDKRGIECPCHKPDKELFVRMFQKLSAMPVDGKDLKTNVYYSGLTKMFFCDLMCQSAYRGKKPLRQTWDDPEKRVGLLRGTTLIIRRFLDHNQSFLSKKILIQGMRDYCRTPSVFNAGRAKKVYGMLTQMLPPNERGAVKILDTSSGWGDRLCGALSSENVTHYWGIDPGPVADRYPKLAAWLKEAGSTAGTTFKKMGSENPKAYPEESTQDIAFTSPPYLDIEKYVGMREGNPAMSDDFRTFFAAFLFPTLQNTAKSLRKGGVMAINLAQNKRSPVQWVDFWSHVVKQLGFTPMPHAVIPKLTAGLLIQGDSVEVVMIARKN